MRLSNYTPGFVESYDAAKRLCRVRIPGVTDGAEVLPLAMLSYPIGDKSEHTEIRIQPGDRVWLDFVNGDARFPIITGFRPKETDNALEWRRWHHANIELQADSEAIVRAPDIKLDGDVVITGKVVVMGHFTYRDGLTGTNGAEVDGKEIGPTHTHGGVDRGGGRTDPVS